jgi:hypothetical protein
MQEVAAFRESGVRMNPDLVILAYVLNDATLDGGANEFFLRDRASSLALHWFMKSVGDLPVIRDRRTWLPGCRHFDYVSRAHCDADGWDRVTRALGTLRDLSRRHGFRVLLVVFPLMENGPDASYAAYKWAEIHDRVIEASTRLEFSTLDLLAVFSEWRPSELKVEPLDRVHPNSLGHRVAARAIADKLAEMGIAG